LIWLLAHGLIVVDENGRGRLLIRINATVYSRAD
jgi:hypothetical protein